MNSAVSTPGKTLLFRWAQLILGLAGFGLSIPLMIRSGLGLGPWDAFHLGMHRLTGMTVGTATILAGAVIVAGSLFLRIRPGAGTIANMILIGVFTDLMLPWVPEGEGLFTGLGFYIVAIALNGLSTGMYMGARLGNGPRDGMILGISASSGWPFRRVRTLVEMFVLAAGFMMGGTIGIGTVMFALLIGPASQAGLQLFGVLPRKAVPSIPAEAQAL